MQSKKQSECSMISDNVYCTVYCILEREDEVVDLKR